MEDKEEFTFTEQHLYRAKCIDGGKWVFGYYVCDESAEKHYIFQATRIVQGRKEWVLCEIDIDTLCRHTGKFDISGMGVYEGDFIESHQGTQILDILMLIKYGAYEAYCPADKCYMENVGFYVEAVGYPQMPLGSLSDYAKVIGNVFDNTEIMALGKEREYGK